MKLKNFFDVLILEKMVKGKIIPKGFSSHMRGVASVSAVGLGSAAFSGIGKIVAASILTWIGRKWIANTEDWKLATLTIGGLMMADGIGEAAFPTPGVF